MSLKLSHSVSVLISLAVHMRQRMGNTPRLSVLFPPSLVAYSDEAFIDSADVPKAPQPQEPEEPQELHQVQQTPQPEEEKKMIPICACCYKLHQFPMSPFSKAFPKEEAEQRERLAPLPTQFKSPVNHTAGSF
jgi:hypothetical protein